MIETYIKNNTRRCKGCDCVIYNHVTNVVGRVVCLTAWNDTYDHTRCDCLDGMSASADAWRAEEERKRKETMAWVDSIVNRNQYDETAKSIPCS